jgi:hypothetical protein
MPTAETTQPRYFTLEAANALIPRLNAIVAEQMMRRAEIETRLKELAGLLGGAPETLTPAENDTTEVSDLKRVAMEGIEDYQRGWHAVEEMGAVLKDPRIGLVDFYGRIDGKTVWLCWKYGEEEITHYHSLDEGFSGRKPISGSVKARLLN